MAQTILITGGSSGIGLATARLFARRGWRVVVTARTATQGAAAVAAIGGGSHCVVGELGTVAGCQALVQAIRAQVPALHVLLLNAGVYLPRRVLTVDGLEMNFQVNYLAPFILATGLTELLAASAPARVLCVSTGLHLAGHFDLTRTPYGLDFTPRAGYRDAKLANALFAVELAERLRGRGITVNAFSPGLYYTNVWKLTGWPRTLLRLTGPLLGLLRPLAHAARAPWHLATAPALAHVTGAYFHQQTPAAFAPLVADAGLRAQLWAASEGWAAGAG